MDNRSLNVLRGLTLDIMQNSNNVFYGSALSMSSILYTLYTKQIKVNVSMPNWINRDRIVISDGSASSLLYAMQFLSGYQLSVDDLKNYRNIKSKTPTNLDISTLGVDVTTGLPGEGLATSVGLALSEKIYANKYNRKPKNSFDKKTLPLFDYYTYVIVSSSDLMEGISYESASLASELSLNKLIILYDNNGLTNDGPISKSFNESVTSRFSSLGFDIQIVKNGSSISEINSAIEKAKKTKTPSFIQINTKIFNGQEDINKLYIEDLSKDKFSELKRLMNVEGMPFMTQKEPAENIRNQIIKRGTFSYEQWEKVYNDYKTTLNGNQIMEIENIQFNNLFLDMNKINIDINYDAKESLRDSNYKIMNIISNNFYNFVGGSSDKFLQTKSYINSQEELNKTNYLGKNINFGCRENVMGAVINGLALSGFRPYASTFLTNSDYMKPSIRMSAIMNLPVTYIFTHDSITTGHDGILNQPIEQLSSFRAMPNINVYRPADIKELIGTWKCIFESKKPSIISLAKTEVKPQKGTNALSVDKGAYIVSDCEGKIDAVIIATGAEVQVANSIKERLKQIGKNIRVVSMPCMEKYDEQNEGYKFSLFPENAKIFVIEYGSSFGWEKFVISSDYLFTVDKFGTSASKDDILRYFEVDIDTITEKIKSLI